MSHRKPTTKEKEDDVLLTSPNSSNGSSQSTYNHHAATANNQQQISNTRSAMIMTTLFVITIQIHLMLYKFNHHTTSILDSSCLYRLETPQSLARSLGSGGAGGVDIAGP